MLGRELADPWYGQHPERFAPWGAARVVALFPNTFSSDSWREPPPRNAACPDCTLPATFDIDHHLQSSVTLKHFVAYVLGAANLHRLNNSAGASYLANESFA